MGVFMLKTLSFFILLFVANCSFAQENEINTLIINGDLILATQKINNILIDHPENMNARFQYATVLSLTQKNDEAINEYYKIIKDYPNLYEAYNNLGVLYSNLGLYEKSLTEFSNAIKINPKYNTAIENLGDLYLRLAIQNYKKVLSNDFNNESALAKYAKLKNLTLELNVGNFQKIIKPTN